jgi:photosystem II stability/assembly factor-like uncharacterized protein
MVLHSAGVFVLLAPVGEAEPLPAWEPAGFGGGAVRCIAVDPQQPGLVYAGTARDGIFVSKDAGVTWDHTGLRRHSVRAVAVHPRTPGLLYAGTAAGVFVSHDYGGTWSRP